MEKTRSKRQARPAPPEDRRLQDVLYSVREGLRKFVPCHENYGNPAFDPYGVTLGRGSEAQGYLAVSLRLTCHDRSWICYLTVQDGDDFILQRFLPFTWPNWQRQVNLYNQIDSFDADTSALLKWEEVS